MKPNRKVYLNRFETVDKEKIHQGIHWCGRWQDVRNGTQVLIKPNLTFPFYKPGVTTSPEIIRVVAELFLDHGARVTICEGGPSLNVFSMGNSFEAHGIYQLRDRLNIRVVDLRDERMDHHSLSNGRSQISVPLPRMLREVDMLVSLPLLKVHAMTTVSLSLKNHWGLIPIEKRFLLHPDLDKILTYINKIVPQPLVVCDGRIVLDQNGPMFGVAKRGNILIISNDLGAFDFAASTLMGFAPLKISHIRNGVKSGLVPASMDEVQLNNSLLSFRPFKFKLRRSLQNYIALAGFHSRLVCKLGYDSRFGDLIHRILYSIRGNPLAQAVNENESPDRTNG